MGTFVQADLMLYGSIKRSLWNELKALFRPLYDEDETRGFIGIEQLQYSLLSVQEAALLERLDCSWVLTWDDEYLTFYDHLTKTKYSGPCSDGAMLTTTFHQLKDKKFKDTFIAMSELLEELQFRAFLIMEDTDV